jgi:PAT family beta-lactamase induction signal transducer AmpG
VLQSVVIAAFALLAYTGPDVRVFTAVTAVGSFGAAFVGVALVTYMSSLTTLGYTATQYALLTSAYTYVGKFAKGFSGVLVESLASGRTLLGGYALFFIGAGLLGLPALILCLVLARASRRQASIAC